MSLPLSIPQLDGVADDLPKNNRTKFPPLKITYTKSPKRTTSGIRRFHCVSFKLYKVICQEKFALRFVTSL